MTSPKMCLALMSGWSELILLAVAMTKTPSIGRERRRQNISASMVGTDEGVSYHISHCRTVKCSQ